MAETDGDVAEHPNYQEDEGTVTNYQHLLTVFRKLSLLLVTVR